MDLNFSLQLCMHKSKYECLSKTQLSSYLVVFQEMYFPLRVGYHEFEMEQRTSVNNNDNLQVQWDLTGLYPSILI